MKTALNHFNNQNSTTPKADSLTYQTFHDIMANMSDISEKTSTQRHTTSHSMTTLTSHHTHHHHTSTSNASLLDGNITTTSNASTEAALFNETADWLSLGQLTAEFQMLQVPGIVASLVIIVGIMAVSELLYRRILINVLPGLFRSLVLDFMAAGEATVVSWELITIFHQYGIGLWTCLAFLSMNVKTYRYRADCVSCPYSHLISWMKGFVSGKEAASRVAIQFVGASIYYRWQSHVWDYNWTSIHWYRAYWTAYGRCAAWLSVPSWMGFLYEFFGSLICNVATTVIFDMSLCSRVNIHARIVLNSLITIVLVLISFHHTGGFFQPMLAFARTYGCVGMAREVTIIDHVMVYWVGATAGAILASLITPHLQKVLKRLRCCSQPPVVYPMNGREEIQPLTENFDHEA